MRRRLEDALLLAVAVFVVWAWTRPNQRPLLACGWSLEGTDGSPCRGRQ